VAICGEVVESKMSPMEGADQPAGGAGPFGQESTPLQLTWAHLEQMLLYVDEAIVCLDEVGTILFANAALVRLTGHDPGALVGGSIADYVHPDDLGELLRLVDRWHGVAGSGGLDPQRIRAADGEWLRVTIDAVSAVGPLAVVATLRLADAATESEQELRHRLVEQGRLVRIASTFVHLPPGQVDDGVDAALAELGSMGGVDRVEIILFDETGDTMINTHEWVGPGVEPLRQAAGVVPVRDFPFLRAIKANQEVHIPVVADLGPGWEAERAWFESRGARATLAVPLADQGRVIGFMGFEAALSEWRFSVNHVMTLRSAAGILAQAFAKREAEVRLAFQAGHDPLTGLPNRWSFLEALRAGVDELARDGDDDALDGGDGAGLAVLLFDLDRFKVVNDSLGHRLGDQLLVILAQRMDQARPAGTVLARMGGDELVVLVKGLDAVRQAVAVADELREAVRRPVMVEGHEMSTTASAGIAFATVADQSADDLLRHADAALYAAKEFGRDRIEVFDETLRAKVRRRLQNEIELRQALDHGQLVVHYQPEMEVPSARMVAVEALVRWHHPERGLLAAAEFIDLAEETGLITELGLWVLREACNQQVRWRADYPDHELRMRVNLSAVQLGQPDLLSQVVEIVHETGIAAGQLCLEITETVVMADAESSLALLEKLRGLGLELAIDDFGTGYSSLSYLKRLPVDVLKIDRSFVDGLGTDPDDTAIVGAVMVLASSLGLRVTAEGVENEVQLRELLRLGCERVQGYFFGRPQAPALISERLAAAASPATPSEA
jgi:diguanylate cyclase (GGDEF)-like protein/PAS domain S-box-containing protein